jgi:SAM-dependent methyltransferase
MTAWVSAHAAPGGRVLEIGAGDGAIARALADAGLDVTAVDPHWESDETLVQRIPFEQLDAAPFDVIFASVSLHHLHDLDEASAALRRLSKPGTTMLVREFDRELFDEPTLRWWFYQRHAREAVEPSKKRRDHQPDHQDHDHQAHDHDLRHGHRHHQHPDTFDEFVATWRAQMESHVHPWTLVAETLRAGGFETVEQSPTAYLFRWGLQEELRALEERLIADGRIKQVGIRWHGRRND